MHYVGRDWTPREVERFVAMYATSATMRDIGDKFGLRTGQVSTFASFLRNKRGMDIPRREAKTAVQGGVWAGGNPNRRDFHVTEPNGVTYTIGGDKAPTLEWARVLRGDGCKVRAIA